jgi:hypothetical protein
MNYQTIKKLQKEHGFSNMQEMINSGQVWKMEGSMGHEALVMLEMGACMFPKNPQKDFYGNRVPSRHDLKAGTKGTFKNSVNYFSRLTDEA